MNAAPTSMAVTSDVGVFARLLQNSKGRMSHELARYVLTLGFHDAVQARMRDLAARVKVGGAAEQVQSLDLRHLDRAKMPADLSAGEPVLEAPTVY